MNNARCTLEGSSRMRPRFLLKIASCSFSTNASFPVEPAPLSVMRMSYLRTRNRFWTPNSSGLTWSASSGERYPFLTFRPVKDGSPPSVKTGFGPCVIHSHCVPRAFPPSDSSRFKRASSWKKAASMRSSQLEETAPDHLISLIFSPFNSALYLAPSKGRVRKKVAPLSGQTRQRLRQYRPGSFPRCPDRC